jgi:hypothetical protein
MANFQPNAPKNSGKWMYVILKIRDNGKYTLTTPLNEFKLTQASAGNHSKDQLICPLAAVN